MAPHRISNRTESEQMSAADVTDGTAESKQAGDASSANGTEDDQQSAEPQLMNDADNPNGTGAANGGKGPSSGVGKRGPNRLVVSELIQFAQDQGAIDLLKTAHANLRRWEIAAQAIATARWSTSRRCSRSCTPG